MKKAVLIAFLSLLILGCSGYEKENQQLKDELKMVREELSL